VEDVELTVSRAVLGLVDMLCLLRVFPPLLLIGAGALDLVKPQLDEILLVFWLSIRRPWLE
jgi:hypothetical protein